MDKKTTTIRVSPEIRDGLKAERRLKADGELETIQEVLVRKSKATGLDLRGRKIGLDKED